MGRDPYACTQTLVQNCTCISYRHCKDFNWFWFDCAVTYILSLICIVTIWWCVEGSGLKGQYYWKDLYACLFVYVCLYAIDIFNMTHVWLYKWWLMRIEIWLCPLATCLRIWSERWVRLTSGGHYDFAGFSPDNDWIWSQIVGLVLHEMVIGGFGRVMGWGFWLMSDSCVGCTWRWVLIYVAMFVFWLKRRKVREFCKETYWMDWKGGLAVDGGIEVGRNWYIERGIVFILINWDKGLVWFDLYWLCLKFWWVGVVSSTVMLWCGGGWQWLAIQTEMDAMWA